MEEAAFGTAVGGGGNAGLVVWPASGAVRARGVGATGTPAGAAFDLFPVGMDQWSGAVAHAGGGAFGVAWAGHAGGGENRLYFVPATNVERTSLPRRLLTTTKAISVIGLAPRATGFGLLATIDGQAHLLVLDAEGKIVPPIRRLLGVKSAVGVAGAGEEIGVLARRTITEQDDPDAAPEVTAGPFEFRPFLPTGEPAANWLCLGATKPVGIAEGAIDSDGTGYAIVHRTTAGAVALVRFDNRGQ
jgi:hypothetical protein